MEVEISHSNREKNFKSPVVPYSYQTFHLLISDIFSGLNRKQNMNVSILNPHVHVLGEDSAAIAYVKVTQFIDKWVYSFSSG